MRDLTNMVFGRLTVISRTDKRRYKQVVWLCKCSCGGTKEVTTGQLTGGGCQSCGCLLVESAKRASQKKKLDLTGRVYGRLHVLRPTERRVSNSVVWVCQCECGNLTEVSANVLVKGESRSCGCLLLEQRLEQTGKMNESMRRTELKEGTMLNALNKRVGTRNTSGVKGVHWDKSKNRWVASIRMQGRRITLGAYKDFDGAVRARKQGEKDYFEPILNRYGRDLKQ